MNRTEWGKQARRLHLRRHFHTTGAWLLGALAPLAACGDNGEPPPRAAQVTDSAGIQVVTSLHNSAIYATVAPEPVLSVGVLEGPDELMFGRVASAALDGAGNLVVADGQSNEIRVFDRGGNHLRTFGGAGEGPGEFRSLEGAWPTSDGIIVAVDNQLARITRFGPEGELLGSASFKEQDFERTDRLAGPDAVLSRVRAAPEEPRTPEERVQQIMAVAGMGGGTDHVIRHSLDGALIDTVATLPGEASVLSSRGGGASLRFSLRRIPLSPVPALWSNGAGHIAITEGSSYEFSLYGPSGALERIVRLAEEPPLRTDADLEAYVRGNADEPMDQAAVRAALRRYEEMEIPERLPAWAGLVLADNGQLWARRFFIQGAESPLFDIFSAEGSHLGTVALPAHLVIQQIADGRLVAIATDDLGVERVQIHELR